MGDYPDTTTELNRLMLHDFNMEYYEPSEVTPFSPIIPHRQERSFYHQFSLEESGKFFGYHKLDDYLTLKDYMTLPNHLMESVLDGLSEGVRKRGEEESAEYQRLERENKSKLDSTRGLSKDDKQLLKELGM